VELRLGCLKVRREIAYPILSQWCEVRLICTETFKLTSRFGWQKKGVEEWKGGEGV